MAALVVELGGDPRWKNAEGVTVSRFATRHPPLSRTLSPALLHSPGLLHSYAETDIQDHCLQPAESLQEDYPHIASYLRDLTGEAAPLPVSITEQDEPEEADMADVSITSNTTNPDLDAPTDALMGRVREIMEASERGELSAQETDDRLREVVGQAVDGQVAAGREIGEAMEEDESGGKREAEGGEREVKRRKEEPAR